LRRQENHASQEACSGGGLGLVHDPLEMLFDGVFTQVEPIRDFFIGESEREIRDNHLLTIGQAIPLLDFRVRAFEFLPIQLFHDDEQSAVPLKRFIGNTQPAEEEPMIGDKTELFQLNRLAILWMAAELQPIYEIADYGMDYFGNEAGAVLFGR
jgi:hypothetical protein